MELEVNSNLVDEASMVSGSLTVMITPPLNEDYWLFRVKLSEHQAVLGFPKFGTIGIGFAQESNWNTNLPFSCSTQKIFEHIKENRGAEDISDLDCLSAIEMVRQAAITYVMAGKVGPEEVEMLLRLNRPNPHGDQNQGIGNG